MARALWSGSISFGLVNIPVTLHGAIESHRVGFHELEAKTGQRIRYKRVAERSGKEVPWKNIQKGYEVGKGRYVMLSEEEMKAAEPQKTRTIGIEQFVELGDIDPVSWDQTYYLAPDGAAARKAFELLRRAMSERKQVAIGRFVMRTKEYVVCIRPFEDTLALHTMFFADEIRTPKQAGAKPEGAVSVSKSELAMAEQLIESLAAPWNPKQYEDTFSKRVLEVVRKKSRGQQITAADNDGEGEPGQILDLMAALKATLAQKPGRPAARRSSNGRSSARGDSVSGRGPDRSRRSSVRRRAGARPRESHAG